MRNGLRSTLVVLLSTSALGISTTSRATDFSRPYVADGSTQLLYHFNETSGTTAKDSSGHNRDASYNSATIAQSGSTFFEKAFSTGAGLSNRATWTDSSGTSSFLYPVANSSFTIEGWFKLSNDTFTNPAVLFTVQPVGNALPDYQLIIKPANDPTRPLGLVFSDTGRYLAYTGSLSWDTGAWYHIAIVVEQTGSTSSYTLYRTKLSTTTAPSAQIVYQSSGNNFLMAPLTTDSRNRVFSIGNFYGDYGNDYFPGAIDEVRFSNSARSASDFRLTLAPDVHDKIRAEALAPNNETDHALPLIGSWNEGAPGYEKGSWKSVPDPTRFGFSPDWQVDQIKAGHYLLPWFTTPSPGTPTLSTNLHTFNSVSNNEYTFSDYYSSAMQYAKDHRLPISFVGFWETPGITGQWEWPLVSDTAYKTATTATNPNFVCAAGSSTSVCTPGTVPTTTLPSGYVVGKLSPFGYLGAWSDIGQAWGSPTLLADLQTLYPDPPKILFLSNNETPKVSWGTAAVPVGACPASGICTIDYDQHYYDDPGYNAADSDNTKIKKTQDHWAERYKALRDAWKAEMTSGWAQASQFVGYNVFGAADNYGREGLWQKKALAYDLGADHRVVNNPDEWDGGSMQQYVGARGLGTDGTVYDDKVWGVASDSMNQVFMLKEAVDKNPNYWYEISTWNGCDVFDASGNPTCWAAISGITATDYTAQRYAGSVQFSMWTLRPRLVRDFRSADKYAATVVDYFNAVIASVDKVHNNPTLYSFWRNSELVHTGGTGYVHPYQSALLSSYASAQRMFLLPASANPVQPWTLYTQLPVQAIARVQGASGYRKWLVYAFSPNGSLTGVNVTIPGYPNACGAVTIAVDPGGVFYLVDEQSCTATQVL